MCVFCEIATGAAPSHMVFESEAILAFLDQRPLFPGHTLVIPRAHHETLADLPSTDLPPLFETVSLLSAAIPVAMDGQGSFVAINNKVSQSVPHLHVHVVPRTKGDGMRGFFWPRGRYKDEASMAATAAAIIEAVREVGT